METFCRYVVEKVALDFGNEQVKDMSAAVSILIDRHMQSLQIERADFAVEMLAPCGSMEEKTRITTDGIEYDYLAIMKFGEFRMKRPCQVCKYEGSVQMLHEERDIEIRSEAVKSHFMKKMSESVNKGIEESKTLWNLGEEYICESRSTGNLKLLLPHDFVFNTGNIFGHKLEYLWTPSSNDSDGISMSSVEEPWIGEPELICYVVANKPQEYIKPSERRHEQEAVVFQPPRTKHQPLSSDRTPIPPGLRVEVDFHPVLKLDSRQLKEEHGQFDHSRTYFLFPKGTTHRCSCWRISTYHTELDVLQNSSEIHKNMFMFLKFAFSQIRECLASMYMSSYDLKTGVLHHIVKCEAETKDSAEKTERKMSECALDVLKYLSESFFTQNLPNFALGTNLISSKTDPEDQIPPEMVKNQCDYMGYVLQVLGEKLTEDKHADPETILKRLSMIKLSLSQIKWGAAGMGFAKLQDFKHDLDEIITKTEEYFQKQK